MSGRPRPVRGGRGCRPRRERHPPAVRHPPPRASPGRRRRESAGRVGGVVTGALQGPASRAPAWPGMGTSRARSPSRAESQRGAAWASCALAAAGGLLAVSLFLPGVGVVVVAVALPEAELVVVEELEAAQPLGALPEVALRDEQAQRVAVLGLELLAVERVGQQDVVVIEDRERQVGRVALLRVRDDVGRRRPELRPSRGCAWIGTPSQVVSSLIQRVTQWMSVWTRLARQRLELRPRSASTASRPRPRPGSPMSRGRLFGTEP